MTDTHFNDMRVARPEYDAVAAEYKKFFAPFDAKADVAARAEAITAWDKLRRNIDSWMALTHLKFNQDTRNEAYKKERDYCDEIAPKITDLDVQLKRRLIRDPQRPELEKRFGALAFALWEADITTFDPKIEAKLVQEAKTDASYTELLASAQLEFRGEKLNLSTIGKYTVAADRTTRHEAEQVRWAWFTRNSEALDRIYDELVHLRHEMARALGFNSFIELGYRRMHRVDYTQHDVENFRAQVRRHVVPLAQDIRKKQARTLNVDKLMAWDEGVFDPRGNPAPRGDAEWQTARALEMFDAMGGELGPFFRMMHERGLLDLVAREGKAGGGFCTSFPVYGVPYIFANFNGTKGDVEVFTHEAGHAFQSWKSRSKSLIEYLSPTMESCEIHSMSLEYLTWPQMERFFGDEAERFERVHLTESLLFLPYGVAVDHFQHLVYGEPDATPARRHEMWKEMERTYLPWRDYGDLAYPAKGARWQAQKHIYSYPFYYIDYTLAQTCALQFWVWMQRDYAGALAAYTKLCERGGEAPFQELVRGAGLISPFKEGCLTGAVDAAREWLKI